MASYHRQKNAVALVDPRDPALRACLGALSGEEDEPDDLTLRALGLALEPVVVVGLDRRILLANAPAAELTGFAPDDLVGRACVEGLRLATCGQSCALYGEGRVCGRHCDLVHRSGERLRIVKNARLLHDSDGHVVGGLEQLSDVSGLQPSSPELEGRAHELDRRQLLLAAVSDGFDRPVVALDLHGRVQFMSDLAARLLAVEPASARGRFLIDVLPSAELKRALRSIPAGSSEHLELPHLRGRRGAATLHASLHGVASPIGEPLGAVLQLRTDELPASPEVAPGLIGRSAAARRLGGCIRKLAGSSATVLITGETGVGKERVARALHLSGPRRDRPFHAINCAALTETLLESELFGHERGAFTGAVGTRQGRFEICGDGTLFLDEIGCLSMATQAKLLRVLEQREFERVGGTRPLQLRARVLAATNADLEAEVRAGRFRADLYYRLQALPLHVEPLRRRREDVLLLAHHFLPEAGGPQRFDPLAEAALEAYGWPGNVRELRNAVHYAASFAEGTCIQPGDLPAPVRRALVITGSGEDPEEVRLRRALEAAHYHRERAARALGISRATLWRKLRQYGLD